MKLIRFAQRILVLASLLAASAAAQAPAAIQSVDVLGVHDFSSTASPMHGPNANACSYCHIPHRGLNNTPLWNQTLSTQPYTLYTSPTSQNTTVQPTIGKTSILCLSCHDGTVAVGQTVAFGTVKMTGTNTGIMGTKLEGSHPFSLELPIKDAAHLAPELSSTQATVDPTNAVQLVEGNIECNSCHNVHNQFIDKKSPTFLVRDNANGQLCFACHTIKPRTVNNRQNTLEQWPMSVHAKSTAQVAPKAGLGYYANIGEFACSTCHVSHNASGPQLLRKAEGLPSTIDATSQSCLICHNGSDNLVAPILNVLAEFQKSGPSAADGSGHSFADPSNPHSATEPAVLDHNRHTTCVDCHQPHASHATNTFGPAPAIRPSQNGAVGVTEAGSVISAVNQFETCFRCHGTSTDKQSLVAHGYLPARAAASSDPLNLIPQFSATAGSSHPVMQDAKLQFQPSLLNTMWDITGTTAKRPMGTRIFCTDCHNSDNNREFGGSGPNGPHGSRNKHILERPYTMSQVSPGTFPTGGPGSPITNLTPTPALGPSSGGPFALCAKCHDLNNVNSDVSFGKHSKHIAVGASCSVCHSAHGVPAGSPVPLTGQRLVNFDVNVVAPYGGTISYTGANCTLTCHMVEHRPDGTINKLN